MFFLFLIDSFLSFLSILSYYLDLGFFVFFSWVIYMIVFFFVCKYSFSNKSGFMSLFNEGPIFTLGLNRFACIFTWHLCSVSTLYSLYSEEDFNMEILYLLSSGSTFSFHNYNSVVYDSLVESVSKEGGSVVFPSWSLFISYKELCFNNSEFVSIGSNEGLDILDDGFLCFYDYMYEWSLVDLKSVVSYDKVYFYSTFEDYLLWDMKVGSCNHFDLGYYYISDCDLNLLSGTLKKSCLLREGETIVFDIYFTGDHECNFLPQSLGLVSKGFILSMDDIFSYFNNYNCYSIVNSFFSMGSFMSENKVNYFNLFKVLKSNFYFKEIFNQNFSDLSYSGLSFNNSKLNMLSLLNPVEGLGTNLYFSWSYGSWHSYANSVMSKFFLGYSFLPHCYVNKCYFDYVYILFKSKFSYSKGFSDKGIVSFIESLESIFNYMYSNNKIKFSKYTFSLLSLYLLNSSIYINSMSDLMDNMKVDKGVVASDIKDYLDLIIWGKGTIGGLSNSVALCSFKGWSHPKFISSNDLVLDKGSVFSFSDSNLTSIYSSGGNVKVFGELDYLYYSLSHFHNLYCNKGFSLLPNFGSSSQFFCSSNYNVLNDYILDNAFSFNGDLMFSWFDFNPKYSEMFIDYMDSKVYKASKLSQVSALKKNSFMGSSLFSIKFSI